MDVTDEEKWLLASWAPHRTSVMNWRETRLRKGRNKLTESNQRGFPAFSSPFCIPQSIYFAVLDQVDGILYPS